MSHPQVATISPSEIRGKKVLRVHTGKPYKLPGTDDLPMGLYWRDIFVAFEDGTTIVLDSWQKPIRLRQEGVPQQLSAVSPSVEGHLVESVVYSPYWFGFGLLLDNGKVMYFHMPGIGEYDVCLAEPEPEDEIADLASCAR